MDLIWAKNGTDMVSIIQHIIFFNLAYMALQLKFQSFKASAKKDIVDIAQT